MEQRARFVLEAQQKRFKMSELCYRYGISRKAATSGSSGTTVAAFRPARIVLEILELTPTLLRRRSLSAFCRRVERIHRSVRSRCVST